MLGTSSIREDDGEVVNVGRAIPRIASVEPRGDYAVAITWDRDDGAEKSETIDLAPAIWSNRHFADLRDDADLFSRVFIEHFGTALAWPGEIELSAERIDGLPRSVMTNDEFRHIQERLGLTLDGLAATLGIARRNIASYRKDKPIPTVVALAMRELATQADRFALRDYLAA